MPQLFIVITFFLASPAHAGNRTPPAHCGTYLTVEMHEEHRGEEAGTSIIQKKIRTLQNGYSFFMGNASKELNVTYLSKEERQRYLVEFNGDGTIKNSQPTRGETDHLFVMAADGSIYAGPPNLKHSSFLAGKPVAAAGHFTTHDQRIVRINALSGHYLPKPFHLKQFIIELERRGVDTRTIAIEFYEMGILGPFRLRFSQDLSAFEVAAAIEENDKADLDFLDRLVDTLPEERSRILIADLIHEKKHFPPSPRTADVVKRLKSR